MVHRIALLCLGLMWVALFRPLPARAEISDYKPIFSPFQDASGRIRIAVRQFKQAGGTRYLVFDSFDLSTAVLPAGAVDLKRRVTPARVQATRLVRALDAACKGPVRRVNHGVKKADRKLDGYFLTIDLGPSEAPLSRDMFDRLDSLSVETGATLPVALCVAGRWLDRHPGDLAWLLDGSHGGRLALRWVNHSYSYGKEAGRDRPPLASGVRFFRDVLGNEIALLERGLVPSVFFRFPGLAANQALIDDLRKLTLIPLAAGASLAGDRKAAPGDVIRVDGASGGPADAGGFARFIDERAKALRTGAQRFLPLEDLFRKESLDSKAGKAAREEKKPKRKQGKKEKKRRR